MCALDGYLYAFGGWVGEDIGGTIERYNPTKDQWEYLTKMQEPRFSMGICVYDSLIYLVGGCTHSRRHMQELVSYNPVNLLFYSDIFWPFFYIVVLGIVFFFIPFIFFFFTFISFFYLDLHFPFLLGLLYPFFCLDFYFIFKLDFFSNFFLNSGNIWPKCRNLVFLWPFMSMTA